MGVRGLQTYLEKYCPDACYTVDLGNMAKEYQSKMGRQPEIVIDSQSCYNLWCKGIDWIVGLEIQELIYRLKMFVESFTKIGVKLVFFFGGMTPEKKRQTWISRRLRNIRDILEIFDLFKLGYNLKDLPERLNSLPPNMGLTISLILKYLLDCTVYVTVDECDEEIVDYASKNDSFAIFAQDSDFIISKLKAIVLSSKNFNIDKMTTLVYDRVKLCKHLGIEVEDLPSLAILAGNDLIAYESLKDFHLKLCKYSYSQHVPFDVLMPELGKFIRYLSNIPNDKKLMMIAEVSGSELDLIEMAYSSYAINCGKTIAEPVDEWTRILKKARYRHKNTIFPSMIWPILHDQVFECAVAFEDLRVINNKNDVPFKMANVTITRPLRRRLYGVLLHQHKNKNVTVAEWCAENEDSYKESVIVKPIPPTVYHPGLLLLWSDDIGERVRHYRFTLFVNAVAPAILDPQSYAQLVEDDLIATLVMFYLYNECQCLTKPELHAMIATYVTFPLFSREKLASMSYEKLNKRASQLSILYIRTFGFVINLLAACGFPVPLSESIVRFKFEGKLYQIKYNQAVRDRKNFVDLCETNLEIQRKFFRIKDLIYDHRKCLKRDEQDKNSGKTETANKQPYKRGV